MAEPNVWDKPLICTLVFEFLRERTGTPVREHDLIRHLDHHRCFAAFPPGAANLQLFRKHFVTRHCLYHLQENLQPEWRLRLNAMDVCLSADGQSSSTEVSFASAALREYYQDLSHLAQADERSVNDLLASFWVRFGAADGADEALRVLGVDADASWTEIQNAYRRRAQRTHPDQGGSAADFAQVQEAYETLRKHFKCSS